MHDLVETEGGLDGGPFLEEGLERVRDRPVGLDDRTLGGKGQGGKPRDEDAEELFHCFFCLRMSRKKTRMEPRTIAAMSERKSFGSPLR